MKGMAKFKNIRLLYKMTIVSIIGVALYFACILFYILPKVEANIMKEKKSATKNLVEMALSILEGYTANSADSEGDEKNRQAAALDKLSKLRYANGNYVWVSDPNSMMVMHPIKPELNGKDMSNFKDPKGKYLFNEMARICRQDRSGFIDYMWAKPGYDKPVPKISYVQLFPQWGWIVGTGIYVDDVDAQLFGLKVNILVISAVIGLFVLSISIFVSRWISGPLGDAVQFAKTVADGDFRQTLAIDQKDEIGTLANALNEMVANLRQLFKKFATSIETLSSSSTELSAISQQIAAGTEQSTGKVQSVSTAAEDMSSKMQSVASASEQTSANVQLVAAAAEQMTATIAEIASNTEKGRSIAGQATDQAKITSAQVDELGETVQQIGQVTETIAEISEQTNLLALNATIEAARAGEAGKGFAVVASEIKDLANQTAGATKKIGGQISNIQIKTDDTVSKIDQITSIIDQLSDIVTALASAMEEQSTATGEIADNVNHAAQGNDEINKNMVQNNIVSNTIAKDMAEVNQATQEIATGSSQVYSSASELSALAEQLSQMMNDFRI